MAEFMRDGQYVWPYCQECGCRLKISTFNGFSNEFILNHFGMFPDRDARGCACSLRSQVQIVPFRKVRDFVNA